MEEGVERGASLYAATTLRYSSWLEAALSHGEHSELPADLTLYRVVKSDPPKPEDFLSHQERGIDPPNDDPETLRSHTGVSFWSTDAQARRILRRPPRTPRYVAQLEIPAGTELSIEGEEGGHYNIWGATPEELLALVVRVVRI
ncbi:MAG: hypothetical protein HY329_06500 [Chloroflexi bacterium]|nr:hypothetical protein [Chloroflexota bacterium]